MSEGSARTSRLLLRAVGVGLVGTACSSSSGEPPYIPPGWSTADGGPTIDPDGGIAGLPAIGAGADAGADARADALQGRQVDAAGLAPSDGGTETSVQGVTIDAAGLSPTDAAGG